MRCLELHDVDMDARSLSGLRQALQHCTFLEQLALTTKNADSEKLPFNSLKGLQTLTVSGADFDGLSTLPRLLHLTAICTGSKCNIGDELVRMTQLKDLHLDCAGDSIWRNKIALPATRLDSLHVGGGLRGPGADVVVLEKLPQEVTTRSLVISGRVLKSGAHRAAGAITRLDPEAVRVVLQPGSCMSTYKAALEHLQQAVHAAVHI